MKAQVDRNLRRAHMSEGTFSYVVANIFILYNFIKHCSRFLLIQLITKTRLYNFDPLEPHCYIVKLVFTGVYIILLISAQNIDCVYSLEAPRRGGSNEYPQSMF